MNDRLPIPASALANAIGECHWRMPFDKKPFGTANCVTNSTAIMSSSDSDNQAQVLLNTVEKIKRKRKQLAKMQKALGTQYGQQTKRQALQSFREHLEEAKFDPATAFDFSGQFDSKSPSFACHIIHVGVYVSGLHR